MVIRKEYVLFVEGGDSKNRRGDLSPGFAKLHEKKLKARPKIQMCGGQNDAAKTFLNAEITDKVKKKFLLIDLDKPESEREHVLKSLKLSEAKENVFFMIQETEAWFFSQPEFLREHFGEKISEPLPSEKASAINKPANILLGLTNNCYDKITHGNAL